MELNFELHNDKLSTIIYLKETTNKARVQRRAKTKSDSYASKIKSLSNNYMYM